MVLPLSNDVHPWEANRVSPITLKAVLDALGEMEPARTQRILQDAKLERVRFALPLSAAQGGVSHGELARFYAVLHQHLGETLTRSFLTKQGRLMSERARTDLSYSSLKSAAAEIASPSDRLVWAVRAAANLLSEQGNPLEVEENPDELRLARPVCSICAQISSARGPLCASVEEMLTGVIRELAGVRATAIEVECHAMGADRCRFRVRR